MRSFVLRILLDLPWPVKRWLAANGKRSRAGTAMCRRLGWGESWMGWHAARNGPYAGLRFRATHPNHLWLPAGLYEPFVTEWIVRVLTEPQWRCRGADVWDVGGHRGFISLLAAKHGAARVLTFEPDPANRLQLHEHLRANPKEAAYISIIPAAAAHFDGEADLTLEERSSDNHLTSVSDNHLTSVSVDVANSSIRGTRTVRVVRLDSVLEHYPPPRLLKIDVEGAETLVLQGASAVLRSGPVVVLEVHNCDASAASIDILEAAGYTVGQIVHDRLISLNDKRIAYGHVLGYRDPNRI